jgi:hypothetical protein
MGGYGAGIAFATSRFDAFGASGSTGPVCAQVPAALVLAGYALLQDWNGSRSELAQMMIQVLVH